MKCFFRPISALMGVMLMLCVAAPQVAFSQDQVGLQAFRQPTNGWQQVADVSVPFAKPQTMTARAGEGVFAFIPTRRVAQAADLVTATDHGDIELEFDYLLAAGSRATIVLQDAYEFILSDSRGDLHPAATGNGGITGYAPRQQAGKAPGLWQNVKLAFRAPEFDAAGRKTAAARLVRAQLNGVTIHENAQLQARSGATEKAHGPLRVATSGAVAFRNVKVSELPSGQPSPGNNNQPNPILVNAETTRVLRSFVDIPGRIRVVHAVSVGHPQRVHYTYDMDHGTIVQAWRGDFLDVTPMWHNRGNGTSRVMGAPIYFGTPELVLAQLDSRTAAWPSDTAGTGYRPKGYRLDKQDQPTFNYELFGTTVEDSTVPLPNGEGLSRTVRVGNAPSNLYLQLAKASAIEDQGNGVYVIGDKSWYIRLDDSGREKPLIRDHQDGKELLVPVRGSVRYSIIF